jgi:NADPH:quinone reductase-like Zn-dependent oxidoreductase
MKAWGIEKRGNVSQLRIFEAARPSLESGKVLIRVKGSALNPADLKVLRGKEGYILHANKYPLLMGYDYAGVVEEAGPGAEGIQIGDEVYGFLPYSMKNAQGSFSEYLLVPSAELAQKPQTIEFAAAASLATAACTAFQAFRDKAALKAGQTVLVNGASGGVGTLAVQIAKIMGAVVWGTGRAEKMDFVKGLGADQVIDYRKTKISGLQMKFDVVLDVASNSSYMECFRILQPRGKYITLLPSAGFLIGVLASLFSSKSCDVIVVKSKTADLAQITQWVNEKRLFPQVDKIYPLDALREAFQDFENGKVRGKIAFST